MRLDKYLKVARIIKRRTVANEVCDNGKVSANSRPVKASYNVVVGDIITVEMGARVIKFEVLDVSESAQKDQAAGMYRML